MLATDKELIPYDKVQGYFYLGQVPVMFADEITGDIYFSEIE